MSTPKKYRWPNFGHRPQELGDLYTPEVEAALNRGRNCAYYVRKSADDSEPWDDPEVTIRMERFGDRIEFKVTRVEIDHGIVSALAVAIDQARKQLDAFQRPGASSQPPRNDP